MEQLAVDGSVCYLLKNDNLSLALCINNGKPELLHFGRPIEAADMPAMIPHHGPGWGTAVEMTPGLSMDWIPLAWSEGGTGDYRESPVSLLKGGQVMETDFRYVQAETGRYRSAGAAAEDTAASGRYSGPVTTGAGMPLPHGDCESLRVTMACEGASLELYFDLYETALVRRSRLINTGIETVTVTKLMSSLMDIKGDFTMTTLDGGWICEAHEHKVQVGPEKTVNESTTGFSSNRHNPAFMLEDGDEVYGFNLIWSGNHYASVQQSAQNLVRVVQGAGAETSNYELKPGESLETPAAVMTWSDKGRNGMTERMHRFVLEHIVPEYWSRRQRPVLYNDWEGCMFDFNEGKLLKLAKKAKTLGCELFVLDDGWFGARDNDKAGLGDYNVNTKKLPGGLKRLSEKLAGLGLDFGLWFEPEAVNPDSDLYRAHPDWAIPGLPGRNELLLDLRRPEVRDYIVESVTRLLDSAAIKYVKWDMNRHSVLRGGDAYDYILGLYEVLGRIFGPRPEILLESCASGGNRFDLGMLCFGPQIWGSDDTDPIERLDIQEGLLNFYPQSTFGSHISASAHMQTLRETPLSTRANVSMFGCFGLELDLNHLLPVEEQEIKNAIEVYKRRRQLFQFGQYRRVRSEEGATAWQVSDGPCAAVGIFHRLVHAAPGYEWLYADVDERGRYHVSSRPQLLRMKQFASMTKYLLPVNPDPNGLLIHTADHHYKMQDGTQDFTCSGAALKAGVPMNMKFTGTGYDAGFRNQGDFGSSIYLIEKV